MLSDTYSIYSNHKARCLRFHSLCLKIAFKENVINFHDNFHVPHIKGHVI